MSRLRELAERWSNRARLCRLGNSQRANAIDELVLELDALLDELAVEQGPTGIGDTYSDGWRNRNRELCGEPAKEKA